MLVVGSQIPFRDAYDFSSLRALKWVQRPFADTPSASGPLPTIVGEASDIPDGEWQLFSGEILRSGVLDVEGSVDYFEAGFHQPTWYVELDMGSTVKRVKSYGGGVTRPEKGRSTRTDSWAVGLAISAAELFVARLPWQERRELSTPEAVANEFSDLLMIR